uniref:DNA-directed RNA polymerase II subunit RPB9-like zinc ribbon domain-containing protein n=1 Tax=viral metagenome TaxID=1070528 RepID=A0A6C0F4P0_9ZZZZ
MHFCSKCENMYYIRIDAENTNKLIYYCRNCGNEESLMGEENACVIKTQLKKGQQNFTHIINKYTKLDPTLPRINRILCPNAECSTNTESVPREIIYIRYDEVNMKYVYLCSTCDTVWKTEDQK